MRLSEKAALLQNVTFQQRVALALRIVGDELRDDPETSIGTVQTMDANQIATGNFNWATAQKLLDSPNLELLVEDSEEGDEALLDTLRGGVLTSVVTNLQAMEATNES